MGAVPNLCNVDLYNTDPNIKNLKKMGFINHGPTLAHALGLHGLMYRYCTSGPRHIPVELGILGP